MRETIDSRLSTIVKELLGAGITHEQAMKAFDAKCVSVALLLTKGNVTRAAQKLGIHRNTLHLRLRETPSLNIRPRARQFRRRIKGVRNG